MTYLCEQTLYYRSWMSWVGVDLRRVSADDLTRFEIANSIDERADGLVELGKKGPELGSMHENGDDIGRDR